MRKFIVFADDANLGPASRHEITPINYIEFMALDLWSGASDMAFAAFLRKNNLVEVDDFNDESLKNSSLAIEFTNRSYLVNPSGDGETWVMLMEDMPYDNRRGKRPLYKSEQAYLIPALHASAPQGFKCADCTMDKIPCPPCYQAWWQQENPHKHIV
jgi:hypothetical protein